MGNKEEVLPTAEAPTVGPFGMWAFLALAMASQPPQEVEAQGNIESLRGRVSGWSDVLREHEFSGVVSVRANERSLLEYANNGGQTEQPAMNSDAVFWIGSVSKQFAAVAVLKLVDQGKVALTDRISKHIPELENALSKDREVCTVEHLLSHTCGLPEGSFVCPDADLDTPVSRDRFLKCVSKVALESKPGAKYRYANVGFDLAGVLVSVVSGLPYEDFLKNEIFSKAGMNETGADLREPLLSRLSGGELYFGDGYSLKTFEWLWLDPVGPGKSGASGNLFSTAQDLHRWNQSFHGGKLLSKKSYAELIRPRKNGYALGTVVRTERDAAPWYWHNGGLSPMNWSTHVAFIPEKNVSIVVLTNRSPSSSQMDDVGVGIAKSIVLGDDPSLPDLKDEAYAMDVVFGFMPFAIYGCLFIALILLLFGPRKSVWNSLSSLVPPSVVVVSVVNILDFYGQHQEKLIAYLLFLLLGVTIQCWRRSHVVREMFSTRKEKRRLVWYGLTMAAMIWLVKAESKVWVLVSSFLPLAIAFGFWIHKRNAVRVESVGDRVPRPLGGDESPAT